MSLDPLTSLASISRELEAGWKLFDDIYVAFDARQWAKKFGKTWTYAEQPYHLAYFDATLAKYLEYGANVPANDQLHLRSMGELNEWNRRELAKRPPTHTVADSLNAMRQSRDAVRRFIAGSTERDLDRRAWMPLIFGWTTARELLRAIIVHNVAEYWKLWIRTGKRAAAPSPDAVHLRLDFMMQFMPASMNRELAAKKPFVVAWNFAGPGGGTWTLNVANGVCTVGNSPPPRADLTITMAPENFHKLVAKMTPPPLLMLTGQMKIKGFAAMGTFAKLFPEPKPDQIIEASAGLGGIG
jgi:putative sterol carrier protein